MATLSKRTQKPPAQRTTVRGSTMRCVALHKQAPGAHLVRSSGAKPSGADFRCSLVRNLIALSAYQFVCVGNSSNAAVRTAARMAGMLATHWQLAASSQKLVLQLRHTLGFVRMFAILSRPKLMRFTFNERPAAQKAGVALCPVES